MQIRSNPSNINNTVLLLLVLGCLLLLPASGFGQELSKSLANFNSQRITLNSRGMYVLSGWALANIAVGSLGYFKTGGRLKYFYQMNAAWNFVNLSISGMALYGYWHADPHSFSLAQSLTEAHNIEKILLLNMGLDVGYVAGGGFLWERGLRKTNDRLTGYGQSLVLQGGFLLAFDTVLFLLNHAHNQHLNTIMQHMQLQGSRLSLVFSF